MDSRVVTLTPLAMIRPTIAGIYAPSRLMGIIHMTVDELLSYRSNYVIMHILVSLAEDGVSNPLLLPVIAPIGAYYLITEVDGCRLTFGSKMMSCEFYDQLPMPIGP